MPTGLITLPLRLGLRGARLAIGLSERAVGLAWHTVEGFVPGHGDGSGSSAQSRDAQRPFSREPESTNGRAADRADGPATGERDAASESTPDEIARDPRAEFELGDPRVASREAPPEPEVRESAEGVGETADTPPAPEHIDTGSTLVESFAEPGAEDGAGAQIRIEEPFEGYGDLSAADLIARLEHASAEELAAVELFEAASKRRSTVLSAVERQLKARTIDAERTSRSQG